MNEAFRTLGTPARGGIVAVCDHAANTVPPGIDLGVPAAAMARHIAWDIGVAGVAGHMAAAYAIPAFLATFSRLVIDPNREEDSPGLIPEVSDGIAIPGNAGADREGRLARFHRPYHAELAAWLAAAEPALILSIHSFTPALESGSAPRPWQVGILYNTDVRAPRIAIPLLAAQGLVVGDNRPYSGRALNATMNRHAEAHGRPYLGIEIRNDLIAEPGGQARWGDLVVGLAHTVVRALTRAAP